MIPKIIGDFLPGAAELGDGEGGAFWTIEDDDELEPLLFGLVDLQEQLSEAQWAELPLGYRHVAYVLEFERHCEFEGWTAVSNRACDMDAMLASYRFLGLEDQARGIALAYEAFRSCGSLDSDVARDDMSRAFASVPNGTPDVLDRIAVVLEFVRAHPEHFQA